MKNYPKKILVTEVGPRDGLQNEKGVVSTQDKISFVENLVSAGVPRIEVTSFVSPKWVPQLGDAKEVYAGVRKQKGVLYIALVPNMKGMARALEVQTGAVAVFTAASETFTKKNINASIQESIDNFTEVIKTAQDHGLWVRGYVSTSFACPYEGKVAPESVSRVVLRLLELGVDEISLGDTIGVATPKQVEELLEHLLPKCPAENIALHFHDTRGIALANVMAGLEYGIFKYDSSAGGLGGCPYAPGASGNLATEDLVYLLNGLGVETGIDLEKIAQASEKMAGVLGRVLPSKYLQAHLAQGNGRSPH